MPKSPDAFRTISEVADWLGIQAHVLRFWESKFTQVKPIKRAGGRRYYRPADMQLLGGIRKLLHEDGLTIKGVQKILREEGMSHVAAMSGPLDDEDGVVQTTAATPPASKTPEPEEAVVLPFEAPKESEPVSAAPVETPPAPPEAKTAPVQEDTPVEVETATPEKAAANGVETPDPEATAEQSEPETQEASPDDGNIDETATKETGSLGAATKEEETAPALPAEVTQPGAQALPDEVPEAPVEAVEEEKAPSEQPNEPEVEPSPEVEPGAEVEPAPEVEPVAAQAADSVPVDAADDAQHAGSPDAVAEETEDPAPDAMTKPAETQEPPQSEAAPEPVEETPQASLAPEPEKTEETQSDAPAEPVQDTNRTLPSFMRKPTPEQPPAMAEDAAPEGTETQTAPEVDEPEPSAEPTAEPVTEAPVQPDPPKPKARDIGMPAVTPEAEIHAQSAVLAGASRIRQMDSATAREVQPLLVQLSALRDRMAARPSAAQPKS